MKVSSRDFFNQESVRYKEFVRGRDFVLTLRDKVQPFLKGRVLDVGSGSVSDFKDGSFDLYIAFDLSLPMLRNLGHNKQIKKVCGDANTLPFREVSFDLLIYRSVLHHLNPEGRTGRAMEKKLRRVLFEAGRVVRKEGRLLVIEPCLPPLLEAIERLLTSFIRSLMRILGLPYVFLFSKRSLSDLLQKEGWVIVSAEGVRGTGRRWDWVYPVLGLSWLRIPRWVSPSRIYILEGRRQG